MLYIKYLDAIVWTTNFMTVKEVEVLEPRVVEAVGYKVDEDEESISIANMTCGNTYRRVLRVPRAAIEDSYTIEEKNNLGIKEVSFIDTQMTSDGISLTLEKYQKMSKPKPIITSGFLIKEDEKNISIGMERNVDSKYRVVNIIPKKFILKTGETQSDVEKKVVKTKEKK